MGREIHAQARFGEQVAQVRAHLDGDMLQLRGSLRADVTLTDLRDVRVEGDWLHAQSPGGHLALRLGVAEALKWQRCILSPPSIGEKLGLKHGEAVAWQLGRTDPELEALLQPHLARSVEEARLHFLVLQVASDLGQIPNWLADLPEGATLWTLRVKGSAAPVSEGSLRRAMGTMGWVPTKTARFSGERTADRWHRRR